MRSVKTEVAARTVRSTSSCVYIGLANDKALVLGGGRVAYQTTADGR